MCAIEVAHTHTSGFHSVQTFWIDLSVIEYFSYVCTVCDRFFYIMFRDKCMYVSQVICQVMCHKTECIVTESFCGYLVTV